MRLGWGRDDGPFFFSCSGRKPHERCEPGPILLCMGLFSRFCVWAPRCTAEARRMGGANGSRECAPDDKLRDTHQLHLMKMMGFAGSTHPTYRWRFARSCSAAGELHNAGDSVLVVTNWHRGREVEPFNV